jgi:Arc/MetJ-type ribon-helix-helix transcriptional regulator
MDFDWLAGEAPEDLAVMSCYPCSEERIMADSQIHIVLEDEAIVEFVRSKVRSGEYASEADMVRESLEALRQENEERQRWEREVVLPAYDRLMADPTLAVPFDDVQRGLEAKRRERLKAS